MLKKIVSIFGLISLIAIIGAIVTCIWLNYQAPRAVEAAHQRLREMGAPMSLEEVLLPPVAVEQNSAPLYLQLAKFLENTPEVKEAEDLIYKEVFNDYEKDWGHIRRLELSDAEWGTLAAEIEKIASAGYFGLIEEIASRSSFRPDWDYSLGPTLLIPEVGHARNAANLFLARASLNFKSNQSHSNALKDIENVYVLSEHMAEGQTLINLLTSCAIRGTAFESLEAMNRSGIKSDTFDVSVLDFSIMDFWQSSLDLERLGMGELIFETLLNGDDEAFQALFFDDEASRFRHRKLGLIRWFFEYDYATYLNLMADMREKVGLPMVELEEANDRFEEQMYEAKRNYRMITCIVTPAVFKVQSKLNEAEARDRLAKVGLALSAYYGANNRHPERLEELVPDFLPSLPLDPFSEEPLIYRAVGDGYALYSVGSNCVDDNGFEEQFSYNEGDLIWAGFGSVLERIPSEY